jgi:hypothetical protein
MVRPSVEFNATASSYLFESMAPQRVFLAESSVRMCVGLRLMIGKVGREFR